MANTPTTTASVSARCAMASKVYTANEMRDTANIVDDVSVNNYGEYYYEEQDKFNPETVRDMLRYAAEVVEENAQLKARLEAVVKACENLIPLLIAEKKNHECSPSGVRCGTFYLTKIKTILRAARGEGGAE